MRKKVKIIRNLDYILKGKRGDPNEQNLHQGVLG